jgi:N-acetylglucosaminyl-diphospho-decaprenol L-rhamnosyltransferase
MTDPLPKGTNALGARSSTSTSDWTFITVTYDSAETLQRFWSAGAPLGSRWIVVDNNSSDSTVSVAHDLGAEVFSLANNRGFSAANNIGLDAATSRYVCFVNPDVTVDTDSLDLLAVEIARTGGLVAPQLLNADGSLQANGRGFPIIWNKILHRLRPSSQRVREGYLRLATDDNAKVACWVMGAAVAGDRLTLQQLGGWDDRYFLYYEDKDLCLRAWRAGHPVNVIGSVRWTHGWARETTSLHWTPWRREMASMARFYSRYPGFLLWPGIAKRRYAAIGRAMDGS